MSQPIRGQGGHIVFRISPKNTNLVEDVKNLLSVKFRWIPFSGFIEVKKCLSQSKAHGGHFVFSDPTETHKLGRGRCNLASYRVSSNSFHSFRGEVENVSANQRPFCFYPICLKNTNVVEGIESLLPGKFRWIPSSGFQRRSRKCLSQSEARAAILFFPIGPKNLKNW